MTLDLCMRCFREIYVFYECIGFFSSASIEGIFQQRFFQINLLEVLSSPCSVKKEKYSARRITLKDTTESNRTAEFFFVVFKLHLEKFENNFFLGGGDLKLIVLLIINGIIFKRNFQIYKTNFLRCVFPNIFLT